MSNLNQDIDEKIIKHVDRVDWRRVSEADAAAFGLAVSFFRDSFQSWKLCRASWGTAVGGVLSTAVLAFACLAAGLGPAFALALVITHQVVRTTILWWRTRQAQKIVMETEQQAVDSAKQLTQLYSEDSVRAA